MVQMHPTWEISAALIGSIQGAAFLFSLFECLNILKVEEKDTIIRKTMCVQLHLGIREAVKTVFILGIIPN